MFACRYFLIASHHNAGHKYRHLACHLPWPGMQGGIHVALWLNFAQLLLQARGSRVDGAIPTAPEIQAPIRGAAAISVGE